MYIDAHTHLAKYEENMFEVISEIEQNEILTVSVSMDTFLYEKNLDIARTCELVIPSFGIHPWSATHYSYRLGDLVEYIKRSAMIGEIGLDFHFIEEVEQYEHQRKVFDFFLAAAQEQNKIINLHTKGAEKEILNKLIEYNIRQSIIHWYSGPQKYVDKYLAQGSYFTIGVDVLFNKKIQKLLNTIPDERLLTETDNPGGYEWITKKIGMPKLIIEVVDKIAEIKGISSEDVKHSIISNFYTLIADNEHIDVSIKNRLRGLLY